MNYKNYKTTAFPKLFAPLFSGITAGAVQLSSPLGTLIYFAMIPLFLSLLNAQNKKIYRKNVLCFCLSYYSVQFSFLLTVKDFLPFKTLLNTFLAVLVVIILSVWQTLWLYSVLSVGFYFKKPLSKAVALPLLFVLGEHLQEHNPIFPFGWSKVENSLAFFPQLIQPAALFGGSFVAFCILLTSSLASVTAYKKASPAVRYFSAFGCIFIFVGSLGFSLFRISSRTETGQPLSAVIIQTSITGDEKHDLTPTQAADECIEIIKQSVSPTTDLMLLPETAIPDYLGKSAAFKRLSEISEDTGATIITGCFSKKDDKLYNSLAVISPDKSEKNLHNKSFLIPFGEYAPFFKKYFQFRNLSSSETPDSLDTPYGNMAGVICVESIFSDVSSSQVRNGSSLVLVSTNDSWFGKSRGRNVHFAHSVMRAVECNRYLLRSGNCGISAVISPTGKILSSDFSKKDGAVSDTVYLNTMPSLYAIVGDVIIIPAVIVFGVGVLRLLRNFKLEKSCGKWFVKRNRKA